MRMNTTEVCQIFGGNSSRTTGLEQNDGFQLKKDKLKVNYSAIKRMLRGVNVSGQNRPMLTRLPCSLKYIARSQTNHTNRASPHSLGIGRKGIYIHIGSGGLGYRGGGGVLGHARLVYILEVPDCGVAWQRRNRPEPVPIPKAQILSRHVCLGSSSPTPTPLYPTAPERKQSQLGPGPRSHTWGS